MQTLEEFDLIDRTDWGNGRWDGEPDKRQWLDPETGLPCLIVRNQLGALCGYVGVDENHPLFGLDYSSNDDRIFDLNVHGGITFGGLCSPCGTICHIVEDGENDKVWWLGFDCLHGWDYSPSSGALGISLGDRSGYKEIPYVENEVQKLAKQLRALFPRLLTA